MVVFEIQIYAKVDKYSYILNIPYNSNAYVIKLVILLLNKLINQYYLFLLKNI